MANNAANQIPLINIGGTTTAYPGISFPPSGPMLWTPGAVGGGGIGPVTNFPPSFLAPFNVRVTLNLDGLPTGAALNPTMQIWVFLKATASNIAPPSPFSGTLLIYRAAFLFTGQGTQMTVSFPWWNKMTISVDLACSALYRDSGRGLHQVDSLPGGPQDITPNLLFPDPPNLDPPIAIAVPILIGGVGVAPLKAGGHLLPKVLQLTVLGVSHSLTWNGSAWVASFTVGTQTNVSVTLTYDSGADAWTLSLGVTPLVPQITSWAPLLLTTTHADLTDYGGTNSETVTVGT